MIVWKPHLHTFMMWFVILKTPTDFGIELFFYIVRDQEARVGPSRLKCSKISKMEATDITIKTLINRSFYRDHSRFKPFLV